MASFLQQSVAVMSEVKKLLKVNLVLEQERDKRDKKWRDEDKKAKEDKNPHLTALTESRKEINKRLNTLEKYLKNLPLENVKLMKPLEYELAKAQITAIEKREVRAISREKNKQVGESLLWALGEKSPLAKLITTTVAGRGGKGSDFALRSLQFGDKYSERLKNASQPFSKEKESVWNTLKFEANFGKDAGKQLTNKLGKLREELQEKDVSISDVEFRTLFSDVFGAKSGPPRDARGRFSSKAAACSDVVGAK